ncbi:MAG TPA: zinc ribbon domain-containing protein [Polyangiaceae bacterium]
MTYEYVCTECGHAWEAEQSISAAPLKTCPSCGTEHAKRQISRGAGFILKGGGWYADGYGSSKGGAGASTSSSADSSSASSTSETKTETKTETKSESPKTTTGSTSTT